MNDRRFVGKPASGILRLWPALVAGLFPVFQIPFAEDAYILPRVLLLLVAGAVGLLLCAVFVRGFEVSVSSPLGLPAIAIAIAALLAMAFSISPSASIIGQYLRYESGVVRIGYLLLFVATAWLLMEADGPDRRRVVSWFLVACCIASLEAGWEWIAFRDGLIGGLERPDGNLGNAGLLGALDAMAAPILLGRVVRREWTWAPALLLVLVGLAASTSRSAWLGALLAGLLVAGWRAPRRLLPWAGAAALLVLAVAPLVLARLANLNSDPYTLRLTLWERVLPMILDRPILGWGEDTMGLVFGTYSQGFLPGVTFDRAHSQPLDLGVAQGLAGVAAAAWFWSAYVVGVLRANRWRIEECGALLAALLAYSTWAVVNFDWVPATGPFWLLAGVCWSSGHRREPQLETKVRSPIALLAAGVATLAGAAYFGLLPVVADVFYHAGQPGQAVKLDPLQARYHQALGEQLVATGSVASGAAELRRAGDLGDDDAKDWIELRDAELALGEVAAARTAEIRAKEIDPAITSP